MTIPIKSRRVAYSEATACDPISIRQRFFDVDLQTRELKLTLMGAYPGLAVPSRSAGGAALHLNWDTARRVVVGQFAVAALYERRNLLNQKAAVTDRRYKKPK